MARFCRNCGKPITQDEKFCHSCGYALQNVSQMKFCRYCGKAVSANASFCRSCGRAISTTDSQQSVVTKTQENTLPQPVQTTPSMKIAGIEGQPKKPVQNTPQKSISEKVSQPAQQVLMPHIKTLSAATSAGELDLGELTSTGLSNINGTVTGVLAPVRGVFHGLGSFFKGFISIFRRPSALIGVVLITILWFVLAIFRDSDSWIVKVISWITFSEGGIDRTIIGAFGGVLGKGTVAAALISLFSGGLKNTFKGIKTLFSGRKGEKRGIIGILIGTVIGALLYFAFTGRNTSAATAMAGISGMMLSLQALGGGKGKLYDLALSLTSRKNGDIRKARPGKCDGLLTGLTIGFALGTTISVLLSLWRVAEGLL